MATMPDTQVDREYLSQYSQPTFGIYIHVEGVLGDPDFNDVTVTMAHEASGDVVFTRAATRMGTGDFRVTLSSMETMEPDNYILTWEYEVDTVPQIFGSYLEVGPAHPQYDSLGADFKLIIEQSWSRFADLYDSPNGGPNLQTYFQTRFNRNRLGQLMRIAVGRLNTLSQPHQSYTVEGDSGLFPVASWGPLLEQMLYIEVIKHLRRSYVEQPAVDGSGGLTYLDRRDYLQRWGEILQDEEKSMKSMLDTFKIANMGLGQPAVLVAGGVYGDYGPTRLPGSAAARPRYYYSFYV